MKRIFYFLVTNLAIVFVLSITMRLLGAEPFLNANGLNLNSLLIFAAVMGFGGAFISLAISKWSAKQMSGAVTIDNPKTPDEIWLMNIVKNQSQAVGIQIPEVAIFNSPVVNAFATGMSRNSSLVAVSSGLLEMMTKDEAEAVIGHEISHIANGDMVTLTLIQGVVNTFVLFFSRVIGYTVDKVIFKTREGTGPAFFITMIISELLLGVLASIVVMWFSRQREYRADIGGGQLAGKQKMIAALQRLKAQYESSALPKSIAALGISGEQGMGLKELFSTHPSLDDRIARLQQNPN
ncbi:protease HtpX [Candidatus Methylopumilus rimovensis]|uniref:protease HtpX n=1 Tax=Candidatus Methylopumilus rimovensis TaxID=2588535 RepID=UPI00112478FE|nr:protease HtpX [Candidatus Methylopumilus rimovensis]QDD11639.1 protease HtpX [Candidatus Methylopumilus rimovensis]